MAKNLAVVGEFIKEAGAAGAQLIATPENVSLMARGRAQLLQHVLQNNDGLKIAVIVNDVASVNIDQKLVVGGTASSSDDPHQLGAGADKVLQLSNGCACCSLSEVSSGSRAQQ